jgi:hypothetical protein
MFTQIGVDLENLTSMPWGTEACEALCLPPYRYDTDKKIPNFWRLCQRSDLGRIRTGKEEIVNTTVETIWECNDLQDKQEGACKHLGWTAKTAFPAQARVAQKLEGTSAGGSW